MYIYTTPLKHGPQREKGGKAGQRTTWRRTQRHEAYPGRDGKDGQEQRRMEISSPCPVRLRVQQGLGS